MFIDCDSIPDFTHPYQTKVDRILPDDIYTQLSATECASTVVKYIEAIAKQAYNHYVNLRNLMGRFNKYQDFWQDFCVRKIDTSNMNDSTDLSKYRIDVLINQLKNYVDYLNESVSNLIDIGNKFIHDSIKQDDLLAQTIYHDQTTQFVNKHNQTIKSLEKNIKRGTVNAIECVIKYTTQSQYKFWRRKVST